MKKVDTLRDDKNCPYNRNTVLVGFGKNNEPKMKAKFIDGKFIDTKSGKIVYPTHYKNK